LNFRWMYTKCGLHTYSNDRERVRYVYTVEFTLDDYHPLSGFLTNNVTKKIFDSHNSHNNIYE